MAYDDVIGSLEKAELLRRFYQVYTAVRQASHHLHPVRRRRKG